MGGEIRIRVGAGMEGRVGRRKGMRMKEGWGGGKGLGM